MRPNLSFKRGGNALFWPHGPFAAEKIRSPRISGRPVPHCHARHEGRPLRAFRDLCLRPQRRGRDGPDHQPGAADAVSRPSGAARHHERAGSDPPAAARRATSSCAMAGRSTAAGASFCIRATTRSNSSLPVSDDICLTATVDILRAISVGPRSAPCADGARLFRLGRRPAGKRDRRERLADLSRPRPICCSTPISIANTTASSPRSASISPISATTAGHA